MLSFNQYIIELFDKPWVMKHNSEESNKLRSDAKHDKSGETNHRVYDLEGNNGKLLSYKKDGYTEIHHIVKNGMSGVVSNIASGKESGNPRFYSTVLSHAKEHLDKGHGIKIHGPNHLLKHYRKVVDKFSNEYKIEHHDTHILIRPHKKHIEEIFKRLDK